MSNLKNLVDSENPHRVLTFGGKRVDDEAEVFQVVLSCGKVIEVRIAEKVTNTAQNMDQALLSGSFWSDVVPSFPDINRALEVLQGGVK